MKTKISLFLTALLLSVIALPNLTVESCASQGHCHIADATIADEEDGSYDDIGDIGDADDTGDTYDSKWEYESDEEDYQDVIIPDPDDSEGEGSKEDKATE